MNDEFKFTNVFNLTPKQWTLYRWLKDNAVGSVNVKSGDFIKAQLNYPSKIQLRADIRALRINCMRKISSNLKGYYLPIDKEDDSNFIVSKTLSHIYTVISDGSISKKTLIGFIQNIDVDKPLDHQMQLLIGKYQEDEIHVYSSDIFKDKQGIADAIASIRDDRERYEKARQTYLEMGGYPIKLTTDNYIDEIRKMEEEKNGNKE